MQHGGALVLAIIKFDAPRPAAGAARPFTCSLFRQGMAHYQRSVGDVPLPIVVNFSRACWTCNDDAVADSGSVSLPSNSSRNAT